MEKALRYNKNKPQYSLLHLGSFEPCVRVLEAGAKKYSRDNWKKGLNKDKLLDSLLRHVKDLNDGKLYDDDTGVHSVGGIQVNAMFYAYQFVETDGGVLLPGLDWGKKLESIEKEYRKYKLLCQKNY